MPNLIRKVYETNLSYPELMVRYGSTLPDADVDLWVVLPQNLFSNNFNIGKYDILQMDITQTEKFISLLDPNVTEPLLTGTPLNGYESKFEKYRLLLDSRCREDAISHLLFSAQKEFEKATFLSKNIENQYDFILFTNVISFAISYIAFARYYWANFSLITLEKLSNNIATLKWALKLKKDAKRERVDINTELVKECMRKLESFFIRN